MKAQRGRIYSRAEGSGRPLGPQPSTTQPNPTQHNPTQHNPDQPSPAQPNPTQPNLNSRPLFFAAILFRSFIFFISSPTSHTAWTKRKPTQRRQGYSPEVESPCPSRHTSIIPAFTNRLWQHFCWQKGSSSSYRLGLLTCGGKPVPQVADIRRNLFPHLYQLFFTRPILRRHSARNISMDIKRNSRLCERNIALDWKIIGATPM